MIGVRLLIGQGYKRKKQNTDFVKIWHSVMQNAEEVQKRRAGIGPKLYTHYIDVYTGNKNNGCAILYRT